MIIIHTGMLPEEEIPNEGDSVRNVQDYVTARQSIVKALLQNEDADIYIMARVCDGWFWDLNDYFEEVRIVDDSPTKRLLDKLGRSSLPEQLQENPHLILEWNLLVLPEPEKPVGDVWDWVIRHKLGYVWSVERPSSQHLTELVLWYVEHSKDIEPTLRHVMVQRGRTWVEAATGKLRGAYARFLESPDDTAAGLLAWSALMHYDPALREHWLAERGWYCAKHEDLVEVLARPETLPKAIRQKLNPTLMNYWNSQFDEMFDDRRT